MRKSIVLLMILSLLASCTTYTVSEARGKIEFPTYSSLPETRLAAIREKEEAEKAAENAAAELIRLEEEKKRVNTYPEDLSSLTLPFYHNPVKNGMPEEFGGTFTTVLVPLGETELSEKELEGIIRSIADTGCSVIGVTGSLLNQAALATLMGEDAVTLEGGTVIFRAASPVSYDATSLTLAFSPECIVTFFAEDMKPVLPPSGDTASVLREVWELEDNLSEALIMKISREGTGSRILFLSSISPSSTDWTDWTEYSYRSDEKFLISSLMSSLKWIDTADALRYSAETEPLATRFNGAVAERLDFIYAKNLIPISSCNINFEMTGNAGVAATFLIP